LLPTRFFQSAALLFFTPLIHVTSAQSATDAVLKPTEVMIVGVYHLSNPGHDLHDVKADDVLAPKRQAEIEALTNGLVQFHPTKVAVEESSRDVTMRYPEYLAAALPPSRSEVLQLGFRLTKAAGATGVYGIDANGDFPWERLKNYANAYGFKQLLDSQDSGDDTARLQHIIDTEGISPALRYLNDPVRLKTDNNFYRTMLRIGAGADQPGADLVASWYHRNFLICSNLLQLSKPGDRIVVFFGVGHAFLLRQCVEETPGLRLVEPNAYIPH